MQRQLANRIARINRLSQPCILNSFSSPETNPSTIHKLMRILGLLQEYVIVSECDDWYGGG